MFDNKAIYGYIIEQDSRSECRWGMNEIGVSFLNEVDHDQLGRSWERFGRFKFFNGRASDNHDVVDVGKIQKSPKLLSANADAGSVDANVSTLSLTGGVYNCNFEIVDLNFFRHAHHGEYFKYFDKSGVFFWSRVGDHEAKTLYVELFASNQNVACFHDIPYHHPGRSPGPCRANLVIKL